MLNALLAEARLAAVQTQASVADGIRRAVLAVVGGVLLLVGLAFLTVALWILLERQWSDLAAAGGVAALYLVLGLIVLMMSRGRRRPLPAPVTAAAVPPAGTVPPASAVPPASPFGSPIHPGASVVPPLVQAFLFGLNTARTTRRPPPRRRRDEYDW